MRNRFRLCCLSLVVAMGFPAVACAQALPADPVARAITGAANESHFFRASDFAKRKVTVTKMSESAMRAAANAPAIGGGVSWLSNLKYLGRSTLPSFVIGLALDAAVEWYLADDPIMPGPFPPEDGEPAPGPLPVDAVKIPAPPNIANPPSMEYRDPVTGLVVVHPPGTQFYIQGRLRWGQPVFVGSYMYNKQLYNVAAMSAASVVSIILANQDTWLEVSSRNCFWTPTGLGSYECTGNARVGPNSHGAGEYREDAQLAKAYFKSAGDIDCPGGTYYISPAQGSGQCLPDPNPVSGGYDKILTLDQATAALPESELSKAVNPLLLAQLANQLWLDAASQPGYEGVPHPGYDAISQWDAQNWLNQYPDAWPTVQDLVRSMPRDRIESWTLPAPNGSQEPVPEPGTNPEPGVDLGPDPGIGQPDLESIPTAQMIIEPLTRFFPELKNYQVNMPAGECPRPSFSTFDKFFTISSHCDLLEQNQNVIQVFMLAAFGILSLLVVLRA